jgi:hypothetical protein
MMKHPTEDQLVLYYYGEAHESPETAAHLDSCAQCRDGYQALQRVLNSVDSLPVPERAVDYEARVWQRLAPRLTPRRPWYRSWPAWQPMVIAASMAVLLVGAFFAGRRMQAPAQGVTSVADAAQIRERVLLVALGAHLERTKMMLVELNNARPVDGRFDISLEQDVASRLLKENRLYRQTAMNTGNYQVGSFLEELERLLLEVAHSPTSVPEAQIEELRQRIEDESLLFKVNVFSSQFESREAAPPAARSNSL